MEYRVPLKSLIHITECVFIDLLHEFFKHVQTKQLSTVRMIRTSVYVQYVAPFSCNCLILDTICL